MSVLFSVFGGLIGAIFGPLTTFIVVGFVGLAGVIATISRSTFDWIGIVALGPIFGPHVAFVRLCADLTYAERANAEGTIHACHFNTPSETDVKFLADEIMKCPAKVKIEIMRDHTNLDWRDFVPQIEIPTLALVAKNSNIFDWDDLYGKN
jgi:hypothetical protein